ncbi:MAG TPA: GDSL-type esterase/lipase family protein [Phycisphaerae bacterium]|nr:GDSL-type esterase/lipase family protein [Phycisphaerae bacterium]HRR83932.1 GDSL-type esterase/lipase family protein [Phycisphaerae bacterium]
MRLISTSATTFLFCVLLSTVLPACSESRPATPSRTAPATNTTAETGHDFARWERDIAAYEATDRIHPPPKGGVLFIGSSTIRRWKTLAEDFPDHQVLNRGFGGSQIIDAVHFAERIIFPYEPRMIVLRAGGNDIHAGKSPEQVFADYKAFVAKVHARLPNTQIVYISNNPTPARWPEWEANKTLNTLIENYTRQRPCLKYLETSDLVLRSDGQLREELFVADRLHYNAEGYRLLAERLRPLLPK